MCPSHKTSHYVVVETLPLCYAIMQNIPTIRKSKEFAGSHSNRLKTAESEATTTNEDIKGEFKYVLKQATDEYKLSRIWEDAVKQVSQSLFPSLILP